MAVAPKGRPEIMDRTVAASAEMREYFGLERMARPDDVRAWFEELWHRRRFTEPAKLYFRSLRLEVGTVQEPLGGGFWFGDRGLVMLRGAQDEAAIHELAHAWWERQREGRRDQLMAVLSELADSCPSEYPRIGELARVYRDGIPSQPDPSSPPGWWRGMLAEDNDHETFAGFCSGVEGDATRMPPQLRAFYQGLLATA